VTLFYYKNFSGGGKMCPKTGQKVAFFPSLEELPVSNLFLTNIMGLNVHHEVGTLPGDLKLNFRTLTLMLMSMNFFI
jgi:hypothetical protein